jgi:hypothetical protein
MTVLRQVRARVFQNRVVNMTPVLCVSPRTTGTIATSRIDWL